MRTIKEIKINTDKCIGCRACEQACSSFHAVPKYSIANPARARIRVFRDEVKHEYVPVLSGPNTMAECNGRYIYTINGKEYSECLFCRASGCPSREWFKEPDSGLPLKCDMCENNPPVTPMCVQWCPNEALTYVERQVEEEETAEKPGEAELGLETLIKKHGFKMVQEVISKMSK